MRWYKPKVYEDGYFKHVSKFLWRPLTIKGETRWLEQTVVQYIVVDRGSSRVFKPFSFINP